MDQAAISTESPELVRLRAPQKAQPRALPAALAVMLLCGQAWLVIGRGFATILETPFLPYCLLGAFAIHLWTRPGRTERAVTLALAAASTALFIAASGRYRFDWPKIGRA